MTKDIENQKFFTYVYLSQTRKKRACNEPTTNNHFKVSKFESILPDLFTVYEHTNKDVLTNEILPVDFYQENPMKIVSSLQSHTTTDVTSIKISIKRTVFYTIPIIP